MSYSTPDGMPLELEAKALGRTALQQVQEAMEECLPRITRLIERRFPASEVDDVVQYVFLRALEKAAKNELIPNPVAWILFVARNRAVDEVRYSQRHPAVSLERVSPEDDSFASDEDDPVAAAVLQEAGVLLHEALGRLSPDLREVARLCLLGDCTGPQAAEIIGTTDITVYKRIGRIRQILRKTYALRSYVQEPQTPAESENGCSVIDDEDSI